MGLRKRCSITNMKEKQRDKDLHQFHWMGWSENFGRIESSRYDKNLSIYLGFIFLCISAFNKMNTMIFLLLTISPFLVSSSSLHRANIGKCTDNQVGCSIYSIYISNILRSSSLAMTISTSSQSGTGVPATTTRRRSQQPSGTFASGTDAISSSQLETTCTQLEWIRPLTRSLMRSGRMCTPIPA